MLRNVVVTSDEKRQEGSIACLGDASALRRLGTPEMSLECAKVLLGGGVHRIDLRMRTARCGECVAHGPGQAEVNECLPAF